MPFHEFIQAVWEMPHNNETFDFKQAWESRALEYRDYYKHFRAKRGLRYFECSFDNYEIELEPQQKAVQALRDYVANGDENLRKGRNIILFGPKGAGKDHLLVATCRELYKQVGGTVFWEQGLDLFKPTLQVEREWAEILDDIPPRKVADFLYISDLVPPSGILSERQQAELFNLVDYRYSNLKPIFVTLNVAKAEEAESRLGAQAVDRLRDNALVIHCNWPSKRSNNREFVMSDDAMAKWQQISHHTDARKLRGVARFHDNRKFTERILPEVANKEPQP
jgi:DNA replication protein DnaC